MKRCLICDELKELKDFHKHSGKPDGHRNDCKLCRKIGRKVDVNASKMRCYTCDQLKDKNEENFFPSKNSKFGYRRKCKECCKDYQKDNHLKKRYNWSTKEYENMCQTQNHRCMICEEEKKLFVDHSHDTGEVRGLLCDTCNRGIGFLKEKNENLWNALLYLNPNIEKIPLTNIIRK